ncbi:Pollen-specific leucine-rich repeat extensin-like protein 1, partial [Prunus dulcis]
LRPRQDMRPVPFDSSRRPDQDLPFSPSETTNSGHELDWFELKLSRRRAPPPPPKPGVSTARTQQAGPSRESCQLAELEQEAAVRDGGRILHLHLRHPLLHHQYLRLHHPTCGDNALDMRHVLSQFTRTMATAYGEGAVRKL